MGPNLVCYSRLMAYAYVPNIVSIGIFCRPLATKNPKFCRIWTKCRKVNTGAQPRTLLYPTVSKSFVYSNALMAKWGAQTLTFTSVTNRQTDKKLNAFGRKNFNLGGSIPLSLHRWGEIWQRVAPAWRKTSAAGNYNVFRKC